MTYFRFQKNLQMPFFQLSFRNTYLRRWLWSVRSLQSVLHNPFSSSPPSTPYYLINSLVLFFFFVGVDVCVVVVEVVVVFETESL